MQPESSTRRFIDARYEYNWNPLIGSISGALRQLGRSASMPEIGAATGASGMPPPVETTLVDGAAAAFAPRPDAMRLPRMLAPGLAALGARADVHLIDGATRWPQPRLRLLRARMRRELGAGRALIAGGGGVDPFGPAFGLIVGFDDGRAAWRRDGQMTEEVSPWLSESDWAAQPRLVVVRIRPSGSRRRDQVVAAASAAAAFSDAETRIALDLWLAVLDGDTPIDPQGHARAAQSFAAGRGELAEFRRGVDDADASKRAGELSVALSRFATMFPWPMGGAPNAAGMRRAGAAVLREAASILGP